VFSYARSLGIGRKLIDGALVWLGSGRPSPRTGCGDIPQGKRLNQNRGIPPEA
jgi:hypothetical protein